MGSGLDLFWLWFGLGNLLQGVKRFCMRCSGVLEILAISYLRGTGFGVLRVLF